MASRQEREQAQLKKLYRDVKKKSKKGSRRGLGKIRGEGRRVSRDYLASLGIGAASYPAAILAGKGLTRALHNREVRRAIARTRGRSAKKALRGEFQRGPMVGPNRPGSQSSKKPLLTTSQVAGEGVRGAVMGSIIQMLRDKFSGSAGTGDFR